VYRAAGGYALELAEQLGISHVMAARMWRKHRLQPAAAGCYMASDNPDFEKNAADIAGPYLNPPAHAAVF
jgi:hypothetical protein